MFYASAVHTKVAFITSSDAPFPVPQPTFEFKDNCFYRNSCEKVFESASPNSTSRVGIRFSLLGSRQKHQNKQHVSKMA